MVSNVHYIELYIQGHLMELESQESLNLRINNVLFNPTKTTTSQAEYSYSFEIPSTPSNDKVLNYANNLSRTNKFHARYSAQVYGDGKLIFEGSLTVQKYDANDKMYTCNLVNIKINSLEDIFGDTKMTDLHWDIDFDGAPTINSVNSDYGTAYYFPLVSYGVFQKTYVSRDEVGATYTPKHTMDKYNRWWVESFYPSLNVVETLRRAFESKGYIVGGSAFSDPNIKYIYASCNLASEQSPIYNLGNPKFGSLSLSATMSTTGKTAYEQQLSYPYFKVSGITYVNQGFTRETKYNFEAIDMFDILGNGTVTINNPTYMYDPNEKVVVIPASGFYKIELSATTTLNTNGSITVMHNLYDPLDREMSQEDIQLAVNINEHTPVEIALIRNYDDNYELIKGKRNKCYVNGNPNQTTYTLNGRTYDNVNDWLTCFPHEDPYNADLPTEINDLTLVNTKSMFGGRRSSSDGAVNTIGGSRTENGNFSGQRTRGGTVNGSGFNSDSGRYWSRAKLGYIYNDSEIMAYDQAVSEGFVCGLSSFYGGVTSVAKNGYSWSKSTAIKNEAFYPEIGYSLLKREEGSGNLVTEQTNFNSNIYINTPISRVGVTPDNKTVSGYVSCWVWLEKDDVLELVTVHRGYETAIGNKVRYESTTNVNLDITAMTDRDYNSVKSTNSCEYYHTSEFPTKLNLFNFTNQETKVSDWIQNIQNAFNLDIVQDGNLIDINTNQGIKKTISYAVDVDDRVNSNQAESEYISYPKEMSVRYKIDTEEWGFELTVPEEHINEDDWKDWGDSGFTVIQLSDDTYETKTQNVSTQFSYTYYDNFLWKEVLQDGTETEFSGLTITIPVIEKAEFMAEGYGYDEAMKHDGYSLTQRFWYRDQVSQEYVWLSDHMHEQVFLTYPMNAWDRFNLSYKDTEKSIVTEYFNVAPMLSSNYVNIEVYLTPDEYMAIKGGALVHFDSDLYYTSEISGYDPSGNNPTTLKLFKKV